MSKYVPILGFSALQRGTIVRGKITGRVYVVSANYGDRVTVVATSDITHLSDWEMFEMSSALETSPEPGMHRNQIIARARMARGGKWPDELTSGVMFYEGMRITRDDFEHR